MCSMTISVAFIVLQLLIVGLFLWRSAMLMQSPKATFHRGLLASFVFWFYGIIGSLLMIYMVNQLSPNDVWLSLAITCLSIIAIIFFDILFIKHIFQIKKWRALAVFIAYILANAVSFCLLWFIIRPYAVEAFHVGSNSMAPAIVTQHYEGTCPDCKHIAIKPYQRAFMEPSGICTN